MIETTQNDKVGPLNAENTCKTGHKTQRCKPEIGGELKRIADAVSGFGPVAPRSELEHEAGHAWWGKAE